MLKYVLSVIYFGIWSRSVCEILPAPGYTLDVEGEAQGGYYAALKIGSPPQELRFLIDTGSSNMAVAVTPKQTHSFFMYNMSNTFLKTEQVVNIRYTEGSWSGFLAVDRVWLNSVQSCAFQAQFSCITTSSKIFEESSQWEGILGMAYPSIAKPDKAVTPFFDSLISSCNISNIFSIAMCGPFLRQHYQVSRNGKLLLGHISEKLYTGNILYTPIIKQWYYEIIITGLKIGNTKLTVPCAEFNNEKSIVDTGSTFLSFPSKIYQWIIEQIKKNVSESDTDFPDEFWTNQVVTCLTNPDDVELFPPIEILLYHSKNSSFSLRVSSDLYLMRYYPKNHESEICIKLTVSVSDRGSSIIGASVLKGFYVVFDRKSKRIGFANASCRDTPPGFSSAVISAQFTNEALNCLVRKSTHFALQVVAYVMLSLAVVCVLPFSLSLVVWLKSYINKRRHSIDQSNLVR